MEFKITKPIETDDFLYDLFHHGNIKLHKILVDSTDIERVNAAINTIKEFQENLEEADLLEYR